MGEVSEAAMTKRKKKGRPSLLDLQKRSLKKQQKQQQHRPPNPNSSNSNVPPPQHDYDDDDERKDKKRKLLVGLNSHLHHHHHPTLFPNSADPDANHKRRRGSDETPVSFAIYRFNCSIGFALSLLRFVGGVFLECLSFLG